MSVTILDLVERFKGCGVEPMDYASVINPLPEKRTSRVLVELATRDADGIVRFIGGANAHHCGDMWTSPNAVHCLDCCSTFESADAADAHRANGECVTPTDAGLVRRTDPVWGSSVYGRRQSPLRCVMT